MTDSILYSLHILFSHMLPPLNLSSLLRFASISTIASASQSHLFSGARVSLSSFPDPRLCSPGPFLYLIPGGSTLVSKSNPIYLVGTGFSGYKMFNMNCLSFVSESKQAHQGEREREVFGEDGISTLFFCVHNIWDLENFYKQKSMLIIGWWDKILDKGFRLK